MYYRVTCMVILILSLYMLSARRARGRSAGNRIGNAKPYNSHNTFVQKQAAVAAYSKKLAVLLFAFAR